MSAAAPVGPSEHHWTLRKPVTTLAIAPQTESLTRAARLAYNVMIFKAQHMRANEDGGFTAPLSEIVKGYGATTRDSTRVRGYIEQMCTTLVKWYPLSSSDAHQHTLSGIDPAGDAQEEDRVFTLLAEARYPRRSGEQWITWYFPPTIRDMILGPSRWAQLDIQEMAKLSTYASVALYEICARYKDVPGGLTNREVPEWWARMLRHDPETKPREWRKFKNETLKQAIAEISQRTSLDVRLVEYRQGRAVVEVQFAVKARKPEAQDIGPVDLTLLEEAAEFGIREREVDPLVDAFGEDAVRKALHAMQGRRRAQPSVPIANPLNYLRKLLRNGVSGPLFEAPTAPEPEPAASAAVSIDRPEEGGAQVSRQIGQELDELTAEELEKYAALAQARLAEAGLNTPATMKRFANRQYRSPVIWEYIRNAYATERYGQAWKTLASVG